jgi:multidrug efflux pump subunit AcrA (membrane-fusion protein)
VKALLALIVAIALGVVGYVYWQSTKYQTKADEHKFGKIELGHIEEKLTASGKVEAKGGLRYVLAEANGKIVSGADKLASGKTVHKGDVLLQLDDITAQYTVAMAESSLAAARSDQTRAQASLVANQAKVNAVQKELEFNRTKLDRARKNSDSVAGGQLKEAEAEFEKSEAAAKAAEAFVIEANAAIAAATGKVQQAEAGVSLAKRGFEQTRITAPCDGVCLEVNKIVKDGQLIGPQAGPLVTIAPYPDQWELKAQISEQDIGRLQNKLSTSANHTALVRFSTEAYAAEKIKPFTGKVLRIDPLPTTPQRPSLGGGLDAMAIAGLMGNPSTGPSTYTVTVAVDPLNEDVRKNHPLYVGYTATDLQIVLHEYDHVVTVPSAALSFTPEGLSDAQQNELRQLTDEGWSAIWFATNGHYDATYIKAGASEDGKTHILEVRNSKPEDLLGKAAVTEAPKKQEQDSLFGKLKVKLPG